ncbi:MAG: Ig-like domain-containing protein [Kofleriaceae bacterium]
MTIGEIAHGSAAAGPTSLTFTPEPDFNGAVDFQVEADAATIAIHIDVLSVDDPPLARPDRLVTGFEQPLAVPTAMVLANDTDVDSPQLFVTSVANVTHGTASVVGSTITFSPEPSFHGQATFDYVVFDGAYSATATVTVDVGPDAAPVATNIATTTLPNVARAIALTATDADPMPLSYVTSQPAHGTVALVGNVATYTPDASFEGRDTFTFSASDGTLDSNVATVAIDVADVLDVAVGVNMGCAIRGDRSLWCWGQNDHGQLGDGGYDKRESPRPVLGTADWAQVSVTSSTVCAIKVDHSLWCWGDDSSYQIGDGSMVFDRPTPVQVGGLDWSTVSAGGDHTCAVKLDQSLWCWGNDAEGQVGIGGGAVSSPKQIDGMWSVVSAGERATCGVKSDHTLWCWGDGEAVNGNGLQDYFTPQHMPSVGTDSWSDVSMSLTTCALKSDHSLWCWGSSGPTAGVYNQQYPEQVGARLDWSSIHVSSGTACATTATGEGWCWGDNPYGETGDPTLLRDETPRKLDGGWDAVVSGPSATCGRVLGRLACWGSNADGALTRSAPTTDAPKSYVSETWSSVEVGNGVGCGIKTDGSLWCWGQNGGGELGVGDTLARDAPVLVSSEVWSSVSVPAEAGAPCAIRADRTLWCWGGENGSTPRQIAGTWALVSPGELTCAIATDATLWCWGGTQAPQQVAGQWIDVTPYDTRGYCAVAADHTAWCNDNDIFHPTTTQIAGSWRSIRNGYDATCGFTTAGTLMCWGENAYGQVGDGTLDYRPDPVVIAGDWTSVSVGAYHTCAISSDGNTSCWGMDFWGEVGNGLTEWRSPSPTVIGEFFTAISAGRSRTCAVDVDGYKWCWGYGDDGSLGDGDAFSATPIQVSF